MQKKSVGIVLFCIVCSVVMSSCVKRTLDSAVKPFVFSVQTVATCAQKVFNVLHVRHGNGEAKSSSDEVPGSNE